MFCRRSVGSLDSIISDILLLVRAKIRYHGNFDGLHAFIPHTVESIVENGYGDCKDMAIVAQSIAKSKNIPVDLVLLNADGGFQAQSSTPTLGAFNHVVISLPLSDGTALIADPTLTFGNPLETGFYYNGRNALFLKAGKSVFDNMAALQVSKKSGYIDDQVCSCM